MKIVRNQIKKIKTWLAKEGYKLIPVCVLFLVAAFYMMFLTAKEVSILEQDGKAIIGDVILDTFLSGNETDSVELASFSAYDSLYENHGKLYLSNNQEISATYPLYVNENLSIVNISASSKLVTTKYQEEDGYPYFTLSNGVLYNYGDGEQASYETYLFLKLSNGLFVSSIPITIETANETIDIPINSILYIEEDAIQYYSPADDTFTYHRIEALDDTSKIKYQEEEITFQELLDNLKITTVDEENQPTSTPTPSNTPTPTPTETPNAEPTKSEKPVVQLSDVKEGVYGLNATLSVTGDVSKITKAITFTVTRNGKVVLRKQYISFGQIRINGLEPGGQYEIKGTYSYKMDNEDEVTETFYQDTITMQDISSLGPIVVSFDTGNIYSKKIALNNLQITGESDIETLYGVSKVTVEVDGEQYNLGSKSLTSLLNGNSITYESPELLDSNKMVSFTIIMRDNYGNNLPISNNSGITRTAKEIPTVVITTLKNEINDLQLQLNLKNKDNVIIENYRYVVYTSTGEIFIQDKVPENGIIKLSNLNSEDWYQISVYGNYDIEDGNGKIVNHVFTNMKLTSVPLTTLGLAHINVTGKATQNSATLSLTIDSATDKRLLPFIKNITVKLTHDKEEYEHILTAEELQAFISNQTINISYENLKSETEYKINIQTTIGSLEQEEVFDAIFSLKSVKTLRRDAKIYFRNRFTMQTLIDFDVKIDDPDNAIESGRILLEVRNQDDKLINVIYLDPNQDFKQITLDDLTPQQTYRLTYIVESYNTGYDNSTYQENYILHEEEIKTDGGITGEIQLHSLLEKPAGKNLLNFKSNINSKSSYISSLTDESVTLKSSVWFTLQSNVPVKPNTTYVLSYKITSDNSAPVQNHQYQVVDYKQAIDGASWNDKNLQPIRINLGDSNIYALKFTTKATTTSIKVNLYTNNGRYTYSDIMLTEGDTYVPYEPFEKEAGYEATLRTTINDSRAEITNQDYYVDLYKGDELLDTFHGYLDANHQINQAESTVQTDELAEYTAKLKIKVRDRFYELDTINFTADQEIKSIYTLNEYLNIIPTQKYLVQNDLDFTSTTSNKYYSTFYGTLDFQGHKVITDNDDGYCRIMSTLQNGIVENVVVDAYMNKKTATNSDSCFIYQNFSGTIRNIQINLKESTAIDNISFGLITTTNYGTIENFVVHLEVPFYGAYMIGAVARSNNYAIRNGYVYGEAIDTSLWNSAASISNTQIGGIAGYNDAGTIENVFILSKVNSYPYDQSINSYIANIAGGNSGTIRNVYSVGSGENRNTSYDVNAKDSSKIIPNSYYVADQVFNNSKTSTKVSALTLKDKDFQQQVINSQDMFEIDSLLDLGYYPHVKMDKCMPDQEYISLLEVENENLADIISTTIVEKNDASAVLDIKIYNPNQEEVKKIDIQYLTTEILSQTTTNQETLVRIKLTNPQMYISSYSLRKMTMSNKFNISYDRNYNVGEKQIEIDFYRSINTEQDWKLLNTYPTENFKIMNDLDFKGIPQNQIMITKEFQGILDGNNHSISNVLITNNNYVIYRIKSNGYLKNIHFNNITINSNSGYSIGIITYLENSEIDNVYIYNSQIGVNGDSQKVIGILVGQSTYSNISNSSINNSKIIVNDSLSEASIGGMTGYTSRSNISNSFVNDITIQTSNMLSDCNLGGIVGMLNYTKAQNIYASGIIDANIGNVGGITGQIYGWTSTISDAYSLVNITGSATSIGGISGYFVTGNVSINNVLSLGNIYTSATTDNLQRVGTATRSDYLYAWDKMTINGFSNTPTNGEILKPTEEIFSQEFYQYDIKFGKDWDLSQLSEGILPKLYSTTGDLLPNQPNLTINDPLISINDIVIDKNINNATILLELSHANDIQITNVIFEYLNVDSINKIIPQGNVTTIELKVSPDRAYDGYKLSEITYLKDSKEYTFDINAKINLQFYKDINSIEDWQAIDPSSNENYRLNTDLDFSSIQDINHNLIINRLDATGEGHKISNITIQDADYWHLFEKINATLTNVTFENIVLEDTGDINSDTLYSGTGKYAIAYLVDNAEVKNLVFNNIKLNARSNNLAIFSQVSQSNIQNMILNEIEINGANYTSGFIARIMSTTLDSVNANYLNISSTSGSSNTGGLIATFVSQTSAYIPNNIKLSHIKVAGTHYVGGFAGSANANNVIIDDATISGVNWVSGVASSSFDITITNNVVKNSHIVGSGNYISGMSSRGYKITGFTIVDSIIEATSTNSQFVGGIFAINCRDIFDASVIRTKILSKGDYVGGIVGNSNYSNGSSTEKRIYNSVVLDSTITGNNYVGGIAGYNNIAETTDSYVARTTIQGTGSYVGGFYGYSKNDAVTSVSGYTRIKHSMIQNSTVIGNDNVGGLIGYVTSELNSPDFDDIYLDVNVQTSNVYGNANIGIGNHNPYISAINNLHVYENSMVNDKAVKELSNSNLSSDQLWTAADFHNPASYTLSSQWRLSDISNGYYPKLYGYNTTTLLDYQEDVPLPMDMNGLSMFRLMSMYLFEEFPTYEVYTSGIDTINIEFLDTTSNAYFRIETADSVGDWMPITKRVYTLNYNFNTDFKVSLTDGRQTFTKEFKSDDLTFPASVYGDNYYYIENNVLKGNRNTNITDVIHVYKNYALKKNGEVYNLSLNQYDHNVENNMIILDQAKPLYESLQDNGYIRTYANFTTVTNNNTEKLLDYQVISSNNTTSIVNESLSNRKNMNVMDSYGDNEYHTILGTDGMLHDLKENIKVPNDFRNKDIQFMTDNVGNNNGFVIIEYEDGKLYGFNYRTGQKLFVTNINHNQSITDYLTNYFTSPQNVTNNQYQEYQESIQMKDQIYETEKQETGNDTLSKDNYVTSYNPITEDYEIYKQNTVLDVEQEENTSETQKIYQDMNLYHTYISSSKAHNKWFRTNERTLIIILCIITVLVTIVIGYRNIYKKNSKQINN